MDDVLSEAFESALTRAERRAGGVFNTPLAVARSVVSRVIDRVGVVLDPSCGTGTFLVAAVERLLELGASPADAASLVVGVELSPSAAAVARSRVPAGVRVLQGDGLAFAEPVDFVVGNPPYVDGLQTRFLARACELCDAVGMVVPTSVLATDAGAAFRSSGLGVLDMWRLPDDVFDASVDTCVLVLRRGAPVPSSSTWSSLLVSSDVPHVLLDGVRVGGDGCTVVAGFRQHYYGLRGAVREGAAGPLLVTSGSIGLGTVVPGCRFDGVRYSSPRVCLADVLDASVRSWYAALERPKVVVATQTRVIEAAVDVDGSMVPSVPVISVVPSDDGASPSVWAVLAVLLAPPVTAWALRRWAGTALSASALKLGAPAVRSIPLPSASSAAWSSAAAVLSSSGDVVEAGLLMCDAYSVGEEVHSWWLDRARLR
jgi:predicted RNA methylase